MKALFDTNVVLDMLLDRAPHSDVAARLFAEAEGGRISGYLCATTVTTLHYLASKTLGAPAALQRLRKLLSFLEVAPVNRAILESAMESDFRDFEDAVQCEAARQVGAEAVVTRNARDFKKAKIPAHTPEEMIHFLFPPQ